MNSSFVETTIYWVIFNIGQKEKKQNKITYCKYKIFKIQTFDYRGDGLKSLQLSYFVFAYDKCILKVNPWVCMTISIQVSKGWISLTHIMAERADKPRTEHSFIQVLAADIASNRTIIYLPSLEDRSNPGGKPFKYLLSLCLNQIKIVSAQLPKNSEPQNKQQNIGKLK